jgi:hypothetical protein
MGNQVTIKLDSRVFYLIVAVIAVLGIFGIGYWIGNQLNATDTTAVQQPAEGQQQAQAGQPGVPADQAQGNVIQAPKPGESITINPGGANPAQPGIVAPAAAAGKPVSVDDVPVGEGEPRLWIEDMAETNWVYDLGTIPAGEPTDKDFVIKNVGNAELVIEEATATCGCTAALVENPNLAPGETTVVRVSYDPRVNREAGKFVQKQIRIKSNDPLVPLAEFSITADVAAE